MLNMPILKFEKSTNFLNEQLDIQLNNKQLVSDIISNINLILANTSDENKSNYLNIQNSANKFLQIISQNITTIEELKREIKHITYDLTEVLSEATKKEKSKEYYIAAISSVKNNIEQYTLKFQKTEKKLEQDNIDFNDFINVNNFKYNFVSNQNNNTYEFSSFAINNQVFSNEPINQEEIAQTKKDEKIDELTNEFKNMISNLSEDAILNFNLENSLNISSSQSNNKEEVTQIEKLPISENSNNLIENNIQLESPIASSIENLNTLENKKDSLSNVETSVIDNTISENEINEEENTTSNIIIDYASIYGNYHNINSTIEEDILNEYSIFSPTSTNLSTNKTPEAPSALETENTKIVEDENIEITDEDILNEILEEELTKQTIISSEENLSKNSEIEILDNNKINILDNPEIETLPTIEQNNSQNLKSDNSENLSDIIDEISDDDLLAELLISDDTTEEMFFDIKPNLEENTTPQEETSKKETVVEKEIVNEEPKKAKPTKINYNNFSNYDLEEKIRIIKEASTNNDTLIISEKQNKIFLPYTIDELEKYLKSYPEVYTSLVEVVDQEFILPFDTFLKHPARARFSETYNLIRNRQGKSIFSALIYAFKLIGRYNLNPAIIAACKTETQLDTYLYYLNSNDLGQFKLFKIIYEINPL